MVGPATGRMLAGVADLEPLGQVTVKGRRESVEAFVLRDLAGLSD